MSISRRNLIGIAAAGAAAAAVDGLRTEAFGKAGKVASKNSAFYGPDGKFNEAAAKKAMFKLMESFHYPIYPNLRENMWVADFGLGRFAEVGMGGIFWVNNKEYGYFGHEIFLLPGQMIPEHAHVKTEYPVKMEAWQVRHGLVYLFGEEPEVAGGPKPPASEREFIKTKYYKTLHPGEVAALGKPEAKHFMLGGPQGAIVTEYACYHDGAGLRFTDPGCKM